MTSIRKESCSACGDIPLYARGWCVRCYKRWYRTGSAEPTLRTKPNEPMQYFLAHLDDETDECVLWPFGKEADGYGVVPLNRRAHILVCIMSYGPRPPGAEVLHSCDNAACFNKRHVWWGTHQENEDEKTARGRRPYKITAEQARAICLDRRTTRVIGADYGISSTQVSLIKRGRRR
jgi:hypothetical protein